MVVILDRPSPLMISIGIRAFGHLVSAPAQVFARSLTSRVRALSLEFWVVGLAAKP